MYKVEGTTIYLTRGDTFEAYVTPMTDEGTEYVFQPGDTMRFACKKKYADPEPLILKDIPTNTCLLELEPSDTKELKFGSYVYDIQLTYADGKVDTFITEATLELTKEVY